MNNRTFTDASNIGWQERPPDNCEAITKEHWSSALHEPTKTACGRPARWHVMAPIRTNPPHHLCDEHFEQLVEQPTLAGKTQAQP